MKRALGWLCYRIVMTWHVWVISYRANAAKGDLTADELIQIGQRLKASLAEGALA